MSRLRFREEVHEWSDSEEEDEDIKRVASNAAKAHKQKAQKGLREGRKVEVVTHEDLPIAPAGTALVPWSEEEEAEAPSRKRMRGGGNGMQVMQGKDAEEDVRGGDAVEIAMTSRALQAQEQRDAAEHDAMQTSAKAAEPVKVSSYLQRFLAVQRTHSDLPAPETVPLNDEVIKNFAEEYKKFAPAAPIETKISAGDADSESGSENEGDRADAGNGHVAVAKTPTRRSSIRKAAKKQLQNGDRSDEEDSEEVDDHESDSDYEDSDDAEEDGDEGDGNDTTIHTSNRASNAGPHLFLTNLPYVISKAEVELELAILGVVTADVKLHTDKATGRNAGTAEVTLDQGVTVKEALTKLQGKSIGTRTVFASAYKAKPARPSTGNSRYYYQNIHVKCTRCGVVGHAASSCTNPPLPTPCYLCAGTDHMDWECPNIVCFNCGGFGHHSRQCKKPSGSRGRICTRCGSLWHDKTRCDSYAAPLEQDAKFARCVVCGEFGHLTCGKSHSNAAKDDSEQVYCQNCGEQGHTPDYVGPQGGCTAPKPDGFVRYPDFTRAYYSGAGRGYLRDLMRQMRRENPNLFYSDGDAGHGDRRHSEGYPRDRRRGDEPRSRKSYDGPDRAAVDEFRGGDKKKRKRHESSGRDDPQKDDHYRRKAHSFGGYNETEAQFHPGKQEQKKSRKSEGRTVSRVEDSSRKNGKSRREK